MALGRFNSSGKKKISSCLPAPIFPSSNADADPKPLPSPWSLLLMVLCRNQWPVRLLPQLPVTHQQQCWVSLLPILAPPGQLWQALGEVTNRGSAKQPLPSAQSRQHSPRHLQPPHHTTPANVFWSVLD